MPIAVALADRPGTGRTASTGGSPCVVPKGELVVESGVRRQNQNFDDGTATLSSGPLTFLRLGIAKRLEIGVAPPSHEYRAVSGTTPFDSAEGVTDAVISAKYLIVDENTTQVSAGASYAPPTGTGEFTAGAPTYSIAANIGLTITPKLSFATSQVAGTAIGTGVDGLNRPFFVYAPSYTFAYALDNFDTLLLQAALISRQGPTLPSGNRSFLALQHAVGERLAIDIEYEENLRPTSGSVQRAIGFGIVWIAAPAHSLVR